MCGYDREITRTKTLVIMNNEKEIPFGAFDSELMHQEISIPEGFEATIDGNKIILTRIENEDEKIRKALIEYFNEQCDMSDWNGVYGYQVVAWLEKQGEHKKFRDSIQVGDEVTRNSDGVNVNLSQLKRVAKKDEKQGEQKPIDKIQLGKKYKCIASPRYSTFRRGNIYKPVDNFLCNLMNLCYECFEPIEDSEQKPADKIESKFKIGDWVVSSVLGTAHIIGVNDSNEYQLEYIDGKQKFSSIDYVNYEYDEWTIADAKDGDVLAFDNNTIVIFKDLYNATTFHSYCHIEDGLFGVSKDEMPDWWEGKGFHPATKEQRDLLSQKMKEAGYTFDFEKKELKKMQKDWSEEDEKMIGRVRGIIEAYAFSQSAVDVNGDLCEKEYIDTDNWLKSLKDKVIPQSKQEWSEEDEVKINRIVACLENLNVADNDILLKDVDWLKSLRPQNWTKEDKERYISCLQRLGTGNPEQPETINSKWFKEHVYPQPTWKPSDEQIVVLELASKYERVFTPKQIDILISLKEQLKKLKG